MMAPHVTVQHVNMPITAPSMDTYTRRKTAPISLSTLRLLTIKTFIYFQLYLLLFIINLSPLRLLGYISVYLFTLSCGYCLSTLKLFDHLFIYVSFVVFTHTSTAGAFAAG